MKISFLLAPMLFLAMPNVQANPTSDARKAILSEERQSDAAFYRGDVNGSLADTTPDYVSITSRGNSYSRDQVRQQTQTVMTTMRVKHFSERIVSFQLISPNEAVVNTSSLLIVSMFNQNAGGTVTLHMNSVGRGFWVRTAYGWRLKQSRILSSHK